MIFGVTISPKVYKYLLTALLFMLHLLLPITMQLASATSSKDGLVIHQIQTSSPSSSAHEFISLYNNSLESIDISNWCVIYSSASDATKTELACFKPPDKQTQLHVAGHSYIAMATVEFSALTPDFKADASFKAGLASTAGHIKLLNASGEIVDSVGWGSAARPEGVAVSAHTNGKVLQRIVDHAGSLVDTDNNSLDFMSAPLVYPTTGSIREVVTVLPIYEHAPIINELFPNPIGSDEGQEFIELYNPHDVAIQLSGFSLSLGPSYSKSYTFTDLVMGPDTYVALVNAGTAISLPNTSGSIKLSNPNGDKVAEATYDTVPEAASWNYTDLGWVVSYMPTPGELNVIVAEKPCPLGQVRSLETGYCRNISSVVVQSPKSCNFGEERNIETGRCRKVAVKLAPTACKVGQERNPATGRCKNIAAANSVKACPAGQERNSETNRCRKSSSIGAKMPQVEEVNVPLIKNELKWWMAGATAAGSTGYAAYEWRRDIRQYTEASLRRLFRKS